jgi:hypothetical protein
MRALWRRTGADAEGRRHGTGARSSPRRCATKARASSSTSSPIRTIRLAHYEGTGPEIWRDTAGSDHAFRQQHGHDRHDHGRARASSRSRTRTIRIVGCQPEDGSQIPGIRKWPEAYLPKIFDRSLAGRPHRIRQPGDAEDMTRRLAMRRGHLRRDFLRRCAHGVALRTRRRVENAVIVSDRLRPRRPLPVDGRVPGMKPVLVFDIETIPDVAGLRRLHDLPIRSCPTTKSPNSPSSSGGRRTATISCRTAPAARRRDLLRAARRQGSARLVAGRAGAGEGEIIQRFFDGIEKFTPQIVSWNGGGFDLPVLHYRGMLHGVARRATGISATATTPTAATSSGTTTSAATTRAIST